MPLNRREIIEQATLLYGYHMAEREQLDNTRRYWKGRQALPAVIPVNAPNEVRVMQRSSRVNVMPIVVNSLVQSMFVDGFRTDSEAEKAVWRVWQANRMDARQTGIHRAGFGYGVGYEVILPGDPVPVIKRVSPRHLTCLYGEDLDWPLWAIEDLGNGLYRILDDQAAYYVGIRQRGPLFEGDSPLDVKHIETREYGIELGVTPVVRFLEEDDLDADDEVDNENGAPDAPTRGQVAPLMPLQDQIDLTTFDLQIAQHYGAFRQRYIIGWVAENEREKLHASASRLWTFDDDPNTIKVGEFEQTNIDGFIRSREASLRHAATLSQTPVHELIGELVNLSAEALAAAEAGRDRKIAERQQMFGEAHEQSFQLIGRILGVDVPDGAQVVWRDTSARAFAATVDGLGKLATMLGVPPEELWERIPGVTQQDVERWRTQSRRMGFDQLADVLNRQSRPQAA